jgi:hypothetical protein
MTTAIIAQSKQNEVQAEQIIGHFQYKTYYKMQTKITNCKQALFYKKGSTPCREFSNGLKK